MAKAVSGQYIAEVVVSVRASCDSARPASVRRIFSLARFSCGFHVDTRTAIYVPTRYRFMHLILAEREGFEPSKGF
jgi:hypothetical protein